MDVPLKIMMFLLLGMVLALIIAGLLYGYGGNFENFISDSVGGTDLIE